MSEGLKNHLPTETEVALATMDAREAAIHAGQYSESRHGKDDNEKHQLIGPAGRNNIYIIGDKNTGKSSIEHRISRDGKRIETDTRLGRYGQIESQKVTLGKREANGKWRELTSDNPVVVRLAEAAIAGSVKGKAEDSARANRKIAA